MSAPSVHFSSDRHDWETPPELFAKYDAEFRFTLDVCATEQTAKCARYFTPTEDGLSQSWGVEVCWMNPPYGRVIGKWMAKAAQSSREGATVVALVPARTDTDWWHRHVMGAGAEIRYLRGRQYFWQDGKQGGRAPFPSATVVYRPHQQSTA